MSKYKSIPQNVLVIGSNFNNKGAQAMLFVVTDELKKRFPKCNIFFGENEPYEQELFVFQPVQYCPAAAKFALGGYCGYYYALRQIVKDIIKIILGRQDNLFCFTKLKKLMPRIDLIINISGFGLSDKWPVKRNQFFLDGIRLAQKYEIPIYFMPQSFGPFQYHKAGILEDIAQLLPHAEKIFARERKGYDLLVNDFHLTNVEYSPDLVLQNKEINIKRIYKKNYDMKVPKLASGNNVGIIPNRRCFDKRTDDRNNSIQLLNLYEHIVKNLLDQQYQVFLFHHAGEDLEICHWIKQRFKNENRVQVIGQEFSCLEYSSFVQQFNFIVCSRFHGIVHAYKNGIPCVVLGWAVKYKELTELVKQSDYYFDIAGQIDSEGILRALNQIIEHWEEERKVIQQAVAEIQEKNCFHVLDEAD